MIENNFLNLPTTIPASPHSEPGSLTGRVYRRDSYHSFLDFLYAKLYDSKSDLREILRHPVPQT